MTFVTRHFAAGIALAVLLITFPVAAQDPVPIAQVVGLTGDAAVIRPRERAPLTEGIPLYRGDRIVTRPGARARLRFKDGSFLVIGERSEVTIRNYGHGQPNRSTVLSLVFGIVRATVPADHASGLEIWANAAVAAVRHTELVVIQQSDRSAVFAAEGLVAVTAIEGQRQFNLRPGDGIDVLRDGEILGPRQWGDSRVQDVLDATRAP